MHAHEHAELVPAALLSSCQFWVLAIVAHATQGGMYWLSANQYDGWQAGSTVLLHGFACDCCFITQLWFVRICIVSLAYPGAVTLLQCLA